MGRLAQRRLIPSHGSHDTIEGLLVETLLYAAELVREDGTYKLVVKDVVRDTVQVTPLPDSAVAKLPTFLSVLNAKLGSVPTSARW